MSGDEGSVGDEDDRVEESGADGGEGPGGETIEITVPPNLLGAWEHRAESAKLTLSEYVVRMAEAGRMSVQMQPENVADETGAGLSVDQLADEVVDHLRREDAVSWDDLVGTIARGLEEDVEAALEGLQEDDVVRYSGLDGGYRLVDDERTR